MNLSEATTKELSDELRLRFGVQTISLEFEEKAKITVGHQEVFSFDGPAVILVNMD